MKSLKIVVLLSLSSISFFSGIHASDNRIKELVEGWQELIAYCDTVVWGQNSEAYQKISTNVNQRLSSLGTKTDELTVNECLQAYNLIETDPKTKRSPMDILTSRDSCHSCQNAMAIFNSDKTQLLFLHELEAGDKTRAEIRKDETLQEELIKWRIQRHPKNFAKR